jgi:hypothetical protein
MTIAPGTIDVDLDVMVYDDDGVTGVTGLTAATFPDVYYAKAGGTARVQIPLVDLASLGAAHADGGVYEKGGGAYRLCAPDALASAVAKVKLWGDAAGKHVLHEPIVIGPTPQQIHTAAVNAKRSI